MESAVRWLEAEGYRVSVGKHAYARHDQFAGTDQQRAEDLNWALNHSEVKAVWASRGGYGAVRILDKVDLNVLHHSFTWMVGYSDFTVFHSALNTMGIPTIHATMPVNVNSNANSDQQMSKQSLLSALTGEQLSFDSLEPMRKGGAVGELIGGNLSILYSLSGTNVDIDTRGKILFIEDLDEYLYHVDRMMMNLKRCGKLDGLSALVVGGLSDMNDNAIPYGKTAHEIVWEHVKDMEYPVYFGLKAGHMQPNLAMRFGKLAMIDDNRLILPA